jgi:hypothetical protein
MIVNLGREILLLGSVRESIMTPSETSSEKNIITKTNKYQIPLLNLLNGLLDFGYSVCY